MNINELFEKVKRLYGQDLSRFYISTKAYKGVHFAILPHRENYKFSEYVFGNDLEMVKVVKHAINDKFKAFYCSLCAIEEPDNLAIYNSPPCNDLVFKKNVANEIKAHWRSSNGIPFLITGTVPQYYYNHLLVLTETHYNTYMIFEEFNLFKAFFELTSFLTRQNREIKLFFNGNLGSDKWHFHTHVTDQSIGYMNDAMVTNKRAITNREDMDIKGRYHIVKYRMIASSELQKLFEQIRKYTRVYYTDRYQSSQEYLSAAFKSLGDYFIVFLFTGANRRSIETSGARYFCMPLPAILIVSDERGVKSENLKEATKAIDGSGLYQHIEMFSGNIPSLRIVEDFEKKYRWNCPKLFEDGVIDGKIVKDLLKTIRKCISKGCKGENALNFSIYKYIISMFFICMCKKYYRSGGEEAALLAAKKAYYEIVKYDIFLELVVQSSIGYLTHTYDIQSTKSLFLSGPGAAFILSKSFNNFQLVTANKGVSQDQDGNINKWIEYDQPPQIKKIGSKHPFLIGEPSATGAVLETNIKTASHIDFIIKANKYPNPVTDRMFYHESSAGLVVNRLRAFIPNFLITLGGFSCMSDPTLDKLCERPTRVGVKPTEMRYIMLEYIEGMTLKKYIADPHITTAEIICALAQNATGLLYAQKSIGFTHYDLHTDNIIVSPIGDPVVYNYKVGATTYSTPVFVNCTIIDYGDAHVDGLKEYYEHPGNVSVGKTTSKFNEFKDTFTLILHALHIYCITQSEDKVKKVLFDDKDHLWYIFDQLFRAYDYLFISNPKEFIYKSLVAKGIFSSNENIQTKFGITKPLFGKIRSDNHYYIYLPLNMKRPRRDTIYKDQETFTKHLVGVASQIKLTTQRTYSWGDVESVGCVSQEPPSQSEKIRKLKLEVSKMVV